MNDQTIYDPNEEERLREAELAALTTSKGQAQAEQLVVLAADIDLFHTPRGEAYAGVPHGSGREAVSVEGTAFAGLLKKRYFEAHGRPPNAQALSDATGLLAARARYDGAEREVHLRVAEHEGAIYVDLADADARAVRVSPEGWDVVDDPPVAFRRTSSMRPLPEPEPGQTPGEGLTLLPRHVRTTLAGLVLVINFLVQALRQRGPFPLLVLQGEQGAGKSVHEPAPPRARGPLGGPDPLGARRRARPRPWRRRTSTSSSSTTSAGSRPRCPTRSAGSPPGAGSRRGSSTAAARRSASTSSAR